MQYFNKFDCFFQFLLEPIPEQCHPISPTEEHYDIISSVTVG